MPISVMAQGSTGRFPWMITPSMMVRCTSGTTTPIPAMAIELAEAISTIFLYRQM